MENGLFEFILNLDQRLEEIVQARPLFVHGLMFLVVFAETGLIFMGALPGDSLLFAAGALAAGGGGLDVRVISPLLFAAAFTGDQANYWIGHWLGDRPFRGGGRLLNRRNLDRARAFYASHGGAAILLGRFIPVIRSVTPLSAAIGGMPYRRFILLSLAGSGLWSGLFLFLGFAVGNLPGVRERFGIILALVILLATLPGAVHLAVGTLRRRRRKVPRGTPRQLPA
jgi:membrane-associated protein